MPVNKEEKEDNLNNKMKNNFKIESNGKDLKEVENNVHLIINEVTTDHNIITDQLQDNKIDHLDNKEIKEEIMLTEINIVIEINNNIEVGTRIIEIGTRIIEEEIKIIKQINTEEEVKINNNNIEEEAKINIITKDKISEMNLINKIQK